MDVIIENPTKARIINTSNEELLAVAKELTYTDTSIAFLLKKHRANWHLKKRSPQYWETREAELLSQLKNTLVFKDQEGHWIRPGSIPYLKNVNVLANNIEYPALKPMAWKVPLDFDLYSYQKEAVEGLIKEKHGNVSLATGLGKTACIMVIAKEMGLPTVITTPSQSIFNEILEECTLRLGSKYVGGYGDGKKDITKLITVAIGKSMTMLKKDTEAYEFFKNKKVFISDESHGNGADQLEDVCHGVFSEVPFRFFFSATQTRGDGGVKLLQSIIGRTVLDKDIEYGIKNNYLCPLKTKIISLISPSTIQTKDPMVCKRTHFLYNQNIANMVAAIANANWNVKGQSTLILVEELEQLKMLKKLIKVPFGYVHAGSKKDAAEFGLEQVDSQKMVEDFNKGNIVVLAGTKAIATGTNMFPTHYTVNWAGGSSEVVTKQGAMGRSTRKLEKSKYKDFHKEKTHTQIWDFHVKDQPILHSQLKKRISFYEETGEKVEWV